VSPRQFFLPRRDTATPRKKLSVFQAFAQLGEDKTMGRRGPLPKSPDFKLLGGTRATRVGSDPPPAPPGRPEVPAHLDQVAREEFARTCERLEALKTLSAVDSAVVALYAQTFSRWVEAEKQIAKTGLAINSYRGGQTVNPHVRIASSAMREMLRYLVELGLTPAARTRQRTVEPPGRDGNSLDAFLVQGGMRSGREAGDNE
jgi:P27 family predicted phage terminase small subunit